jgi:hypothetical protein
MPEEVEAEAEAEAVAVVMLEAAVATPGVEAGTPEVTLEAVVARPEVVAATPAVEVVTLEVVAATQRPRHRRTSPDRAAWWSGWGTR